MNVDTNGKYDATVVIDEQRASLSEISVTGSGRYGELTGSVDGENASIEASTDNASVKIDTEGKFEGKSSYKMNNTEYSAGYKLGIGELDIYYSAGSTSQYVLDKATRDWGISAIDFSGYSLSSPRTRLFTDGIDIYMNTSTLTDNKLLKYDRNMMTFNVVANSYAYKSPNMMFSKYVVCPTCQCKGMLPALGNINPNTDDIYCIVGDRIYAMDKIEAD